MNIITVKEDETANCNCEVPTLGVNTWTCGCGQSFKVKEKMTNAPEINIAECTSVVLPKQHTGNLTLKQYIRMIRRDEHMMLTEYGKSLVTWNILQCIKDFVKVSKIVGDGSGFDYLVVLK